MADSRSGKPINRVDPREIKQYSPIKDSRSYYKHFPDRFSYNAVVHSSFYNGTHAPIAGWLSHEHQRGHTSDSRAGEAVELTVATSLLTMLSDVLINSVELFTHDDRGMVNGLSAHAVDQNLTFSALQAIPEVYEDRDVDHMSK